MKKILKLLKKSKLGFEDFSKNTVLCLMTFLLNQDCCSFSKKKVYIEPLQYKIRKHWTAKIVKNEPMLVQEDSFGVYVPLKHSLKLFLGLPGMYNKIDSYIKSLCKNSKLLSNVMQGRLWIEKYAALYANVIVFPLFMFYDKLELGNPLGSSAGINKLEAVYFCLDCLPPDISSRLSRIIFSTLFRASDHEHSNNKEILRRIIAELNDHSKHGITIMVHGIKKVVKFQLVLILGDNLGLNTICGFIKCFKSNYFCHFCKVTTQEAASLTAEIVEKFRDRQN